MASDDVNGILFRGINSFGTEGTTGSLGYRLHSIHQDLCFKYLDGDEELSLRIEELKTIIKKQQEEINELKALVVSLIKTKAD